MSPVESRQIAEVKETVDELAKTTSRINLALIGDEYTEEKGLIHKVSELDRRLTDIEKALLIFKSKWAAIVMALLGLSGFAALVYYISAIFHNIAK